MACTAPIYGARGPTGVVVGARKKTYNFGGQRLNLTLPCGRCMSCRVDRKRQWGVRLMHEAQMHAETSYITLTYDDSFLPPGGSLVVEHAQLFIKRFRERLSPNPIRYYLCGEYGDVKARPHYHAIIFGWWPQDASFEKNVGEHPYYSSRFLEDVWGKGLCWISGVSFDSASYVAGYVTKKISGDKAAAHYGDRVPEFALMSRKPAIGIPWLEKYGNETWRDDSVVVNGVEIAPPRAYARFLCKTNEEAYKSLQSKRHRPWSTESATELRSRDMRVKSRVGLKSSTL